MSDRRSYLLVGAAVLAVAAAARTVPLYWSPLPHVLDDFAHAGIARETLAAGGWTTDHGPTRVGRTTFGADVGVGPTRTWLRGGPPPACPMPSFAGWTTDGATFWPAAPATTDRRRYRATLDSRNVVHAVDGKTATLSLPRDGGECGGTDAPTALGARPSGVRR
ncbi:hypothetical protein BRD02_00195 [Halobacteriales archaeon QS_8_69_73]|nr:MAG: hypothetical protein BRD02_00195 [Halobacteriales archaeon QS_8_69_73]